MRQPPIGRLSGGNPVGCRRPNKSSFASFVGFVGKKEL